MVLIESNERMRMDGYTCLHVDETIPRVKRHAIDETGHKEASDDHQAHVRGVEFVEEVSLRGLCLPSQRLHMAHLGPFLPFNARAS